MTKTTFISTRKNLSVVLIGGQEISKG